MSGEKATKDGQWSVREAIADHAKAEADERRARGERGVTQEKMERIARQAYVENEKRKERK